MVRERIKFPDFEIFQVNSKFPSMTNGQIDMVFIIQKLLENHPYSWAQQEIISIFTNFERFNCYLGVSFSERQYSNNCQFSLQFVMLLVLQKRESLISMLLLPLKTFE